MSKLTAFDKFLMSVAPRYAAKRIRSRLVADTMARHYEAAQGSRRTTGWQRNRGDANAVIGPALVELRTHARDLQRNNAWAKRATQVIAHNTVGWGIVPKAINNPTADAIWKQWADSTECETEGRFTFYGIQSLAAKTIPVSGEILLRRRWRRPGDGLGLPMQIQVLEPDFLDTTKDSIPGPSGGMIVQGVEFDKIGRRVAYWLFEQHPGGAFSTGLSKRVPAKDIIHGYLPERPGQTRGISWFGAAIVPLKDFDEFEDAQLLKQKIAACFAAFVTDTDGMGSRMGAAPDDDDDAIDTLEPGMIHNLPDGKAVTFGNPPSNTDDGFSNRNLRRIAAALGVTYEDMTGDYSQVNFSSARMARISHWANVYDWQWHMMIPLVCDGVWRWVMEAAVLAGKLPEGEVPVGWTCPPMPMIEPDKEGLALGRLVRVGAMTPSDMVRERGGDPTAHWEEYAADMKTLDALGIKLDSDVRAVSQAGLTQERAGGDAGGGKPAPADEAPDDGAEDRAWFEVDDSEFRKSALEAVRSFLPGAK